MTNLDFAFWLVAGIGLLALVVAAFIPLEDKKVSQASAHGDLSPDNIVVSIHESESGEAFAVVVMGGEIRRMRLRGAKRPETTTATDLSPLELGLARR